MKQSQGWNPSRLRSNPLLITAMRHSPVLAHSGCSVCFLSIGPKVKVKVAQSCPILCNTMDYTVRGILQARILEWVAFPFSGVSSQPRDRVQVSHTAGRFFPS